MERDNDGLVPLYEFSKGFLRYPVLSAYLDIWNAGVTDEVESAFVGNLEQCCDIGSGQEWGD